MWGSVDGENDSPSHHLLGTCSHLFVRLTLMQKKKQQQKRGKEEKKQQFKSSPHLRCGKIVRSILVFKNKPQDTILWLFEGLMQRFEFMGAFLIWCIFTLGKKTHSHNVPRPLDLQTWALFPLEELFTQNTWTVPLILPRASNLLELHYLLKKKKKWGGNFLISLNSWRGGAACYSDWLNTTSMFVPASGCKVL